MKIVHVITRSDEIGGAQVHLNNLSLGLKSLGHKNIVIAGGNGIFFEQLSKVGLKHISLKNLVRPIRPLSDMSAILELSKILKEINPDIVTAHSFKAGLITRIACFLVGKKCIFTAHGWSFIKCANPIMKLLYIFIERILTFVSYKIITVCENDKRFAVATAISSDQKLAVVYNGSPDVDLRFIAQHQNVTTKIIMVARFDWPKDHMILIKSLQEIQDYSWSLVLVGDGPYLEEVKSLVNNLNLDERITFLGRREDIAELLSQSDIFVLTSHAEGFPISVIEAMRASLPIVATNTGGISEAVIDNKTGFLVADKDQENLKGKLLQLISNSELRIQMGFAGREQYLKQFTNREMVKATVAIYEEVVSA